MEVVNAWTGLDREKDNGLREMERKGLARVYLVLQKGSLEPVDIAGKSIQEIFELEDAAPGHLYMIAESPELAKMRFYDAQDQWRYYTGTGIFDPDIVKLPEGNRPRW